MKKGMLLALCLVLATDAQSYCDLCSDHTMCIYQGRGSNCGQPVYSGVSSDTDKQTIVDAHNNLRSGVAQGRESKGSPGPQPPAANMRKVVWDNELATVAQRWADQCSFGHDKCRRVSRFSVGQNVYQSSTMGVNPNGQQDWKAAVQGWYDEVQVFSRNDVNPFKFSQETGHYSQVVWADTCKVGCGFTAYMSPDGWYNKYYVYDYGPAGNVVGGGSSMYAEGSACSQCPAGTTVCENGLCV